MKNEYPKVHEYKGMLVCISYDNKNVKVFKDAELHKEFKIPEENSDPLKDVVLEEDGQPKTEEGMQDKLEMVRRAHESGVVML